MRMHELFGKWNLKLIIGNILPKGEIRLELISTFILPDEDSFAFGMRLGESSVMVRYVLWN